MRHRFFIGIDPLKCKKQINMLSASYLTFRRANLSLMGCTSAEPISVSVRSKVQRIKLYLQTVEIPNHFQYHKQKKALVKQKGTKMFFLIYFLFGSSS